jgi:hypothetical protein
LAVRGAIAGSRERVEHFGLRPAAEERKEDALGVRVAETENRATFGADQESLIEVVAPKPAAQDGLLAACVERREIAALMANAVVVALSMREVRDDLVRA